AAERDERRRARPDLALEALDRGLHLVLAEVLLHLDVETVPLQRLGEGLRVLTRMAQRCAGIGIFGIADDEGDARRAGVADGLRRLRESRLRLLRHQLVEARADGECHAQQPAQWERIFGHAERTELEHGETQFEDALPAQWHCAAAKNVTGVTLGYRTGASAPRAP